MKAEDFENRLRELVRRKPFEPFVVIVNDGRSIHVDEPAVAFGGGKAGFIGPDELVEFFNCENVVAFQPASRETAP
jgi:hypothetical protein